MRTVNLFLLLVVAACCTPSFADASSKPRKRFLCVSSSENGDHVVHVKQGDGKNENASLVVFKFDSTSRTYVRVKQLKLLNRSSPDRTYITDRGRYFVTTNAFYEEGNQEHAVVIYDLVEDKHKRFAVRDFMPKRMEERFSGLAMGHWLWCSGPSTLDNKTLELRIFPPTGSREPYVVVDIARMKISVKDAPPEELRMKEEPDLKGEAWAKYWFETTAAKEKAKQPKVELGGIGPVAIAETDGTLLLRTEPAGKSQKAKALVLQYNAKDQTYNKLHDVVLKNSVAPAFAKVTNDGRYLITLDDIGQIGVTDNAVVIYDLRAGKSKAFAIKDFLSQDDIAKLRQVENVRLWRALSAFFHSKLDEEDQKFYPTRPGRVGLDSSRYPAVVVDLVNMKVYLKEPFDPKPLE